MSREDRKRAHAKAAEAGAAERIAKHDQHFAREYIAAGGDKPVSAALLKTMGFTEAELDLARRARHDEFPPKGQAA